MNEVAVRRNITKLSRDFVGEWCSHPSELLANDTMKVTDVEVISKIQRRCSVLGCCFTLRARFTMAANSLPNPLAAFTYDQ